GLARGSRIAVLSETRPEYVETYAACAALGVTVVSLNIRLHPDELLHCLEKGRPTLLLVSDTLAPVAATLRGRASSVLHWLAIGGGEGGVDYEAALPQAAPHE